MRIEFYFCREYLKKVNVNTYWNNNATMLFSLSNDSVVKDSIGEITRNTVVDNDFFVQDCGEWSCSVKFSQQLFDILFTKKAHRYFKKLSMYVVRVFDDSDNNIFDGAIKFGGNTISADKKTITFSAYDWLIFVDEIKPVESDSLIDLHLIGYLHKYILGHYGYYPGFVNFLGTTYFKINEDGSEWNEMTALEPWRLIDDGVNPEPLAEFQTRSFLMTDNGSSFVCQLPVGYVPDPAVPVGYLLTTAVSCFTKDSYDFYYHVLVGYSGNGVRCEYWKFRCWNAAEFEAVPELSTGNQSKVYDYTYTTADNLKTKLLQIVGGSSLQTSMVYNSTNYSITGGNNSLGVVFDVENGMIQPGRFRLPITISGYPTLSILRTENKDLLAKALFVENRGLSVLGYTFSIKKKSDFVDSANDYTIIPKYQGVEWNLTTVEPEPFDLGIFDSVPGYNKIADVVCLEYWLKQRVEKFINGVTTSLEYTTKESVDLADVIVLEDMPKPIKFRVSEISFNPLRPKLKNIVAYNISDGSALVSQPVVIKSGSQILMSAQQGASIYYTYHATQQPANPTSYNNLYSSPISLVYGYYKAVAKIGTVYSAVTSFQAAPEMLSNAIIHYYLKAYNFGTKDDQNHYFMNMYIFKEAERGSDVVTCVIFNMDSDSWPYKMGIERYVFNGNQLIDSSSEYMELRADQIGSYLSASHLQYISNFLALAGYTGAYNNYTLNTLTFTDNAGLHRSYTTVGWTIEEPYMRYSGLKTF